MFNVFVVKKWSSLLLSSFLGAIGFVVGNIYYGLWGGFGFFGGALLLSLVIGNALLKNPFSCLLEGKGILAITMDSTGILQPFIFHVMSPFMVAKLNGMPIRDVFDREAVFQMAEPKVSPRFAIPDGTGGISIDLSVQDFNESRFAMFHYPVILYNAQNNSVITKTDLAEMEKTSFAEHGVLYLNRQMEQLTSAIRDFGRYVVETLKPKTDFLKSKWVIIILVIFVVIMLALFGPSIIETIGGVSSSGGDALATATKSTAPVIPQGG